MIQTPTWLSACNIFAHFVSLSLSLVFWTCTPDILMLYLLDLLLLRPVLWKRVKCCNFKCWREEISYAVFYERSFGGSRKQKAWPEVKFATYVKSDFCMLTICNIELCFGMNAGFLSGLLETASCELHHTPHRFQISFFILLSRNISMCQSVIILPQWIFLVYAFLMSNVFVNGLFLLL